jgi:hypothetical protein
VLALAKSPRAARLKWISLNGNNISEAGVEALAASPYLELRGPDVPRPLELWLLDDAARQNSRMWASRRLRGEACNLSPRSA